ncbi:uncharacterized protein LOC135844632 [Planococcus citri]|uniref:uncharacterized protein LOC135844632 n=1 Tax=Planococcus citri TaxID=170843 RepID=UPI0031F8E208
MQITPELLDSSLFESLQRELFDVPNLNSLSVEYEEFNHKNYSWMLPVNLTRLFLSNGIFEFDLRNCSRLVSLRLNRNKLSKIPSFHHPLPPLKVLHLRLNPLNEFTLNDVVGFFELEYYAMDTANITNCECKKLKQWIMKSQSWRNFTFEGDLNCNDSIDRYSNCTFDEMLETEDNTSSLYISKAFALTGGFTVAIAAVCFLVCCCCLCIMTCAAISNSFGQQGFGFSPFSPFSPFGMGGFGYGMPGMGYGMPGMGYGMPGMGYGMPGPGIGMGMPGPGPEPRYNDRGGERIEDRDPGWGGRGGDDRYTGEFDAPDNADNDEVFQVTSCDASVL